MKPLYRLSKITKRYGQRTVLALDELEIDEGETAALIGRAARENQRCCGCSAV
jgi:ABC-type sugar transport system ATPase subunit